MIQVILVFLLFAVIHSITAATKFKLACREIFGDSFMRAWYRAFFTAVSFITAAVAFLCIRRTPDYAIWTAPGWLWWAMFCVQTAGSVFGSFAFEHLDAGEFLGYKQVRRYLARGGVGGNIEGLTQQELVMTGVYGIVRHPLYLAGIIIFTFNPRITANGLTVTVLADVYFLFGVFMEERRLAGLFGEQYREYRRRVPMMIPRLKR
jgi:protein-S-isoprenylcysteine O-methyltransferase Ste14